MREVSIEMGDKMLCGLDNADKWYIYSFGYVGRVGIHGISKKNFPFLDIFDFLSLPFASRGYFLHRFGVFCHEKENR